MLATFNAHFIKIGGHIINLSNICSVELDYIDYETTGVAIRFVDGTTLMFWDKDAEVLRWYFSHPVSRAIDIKNLSGL